MRKDRLLKLADFLETVPRRAFNMKVWEAKRATKPEGKRLGECGFAGCAMGWAAHQKLFRGLTIKSSELYYKKPCGEWLDGYCAAAAPFDISVEQGQYLFDPYRYGPDRFVPATPTPKQVAKRIREFVKSSGEAKSSP